MHQTRFCLVLSVLMLLWLPSLAAQDAVKVMERVRQEKAWLELTPRPEDFIGAEIGPERLEQRKDEIRAGIRTMLGSTREPRRADNIRVLGYNADRAALSVDNGDLNLHHYFSMPPQEANRIIANPRFWYLSAYREMNWDLTWDYDGWELKGPDRSYAEQPEPVYTIPPPITRDEYTQPVPDPTEKLLATEPEAYLAYQSYQSGDFQSSLYGFTLAQLGSQLPNPVHTYWIARNHLALGDTPKAVQWLKQYQRSGHQLYASEARQLLEIVNRQYHIFRNVDRLAMPEGLTSPGGETRFGIDPVSGDLYFSSGRSTDYNGSNIWRARSSMDGWAPPELVKELCSNADEALSSFSSDGKTAWLSGKYDSGRRDFDILYSTRQDSLWQRPTMVRELSSSYDDIDPWLHDDRVMIFSSSRPGGYGGFDLWYSEFIDGSWQVPLNMGAAVNTAGDEDAPFLDWDGKTLYFCSDGYPGLGASDLFKAVKLQSGWQGWSLPENLGPVINSPARERGFLHLKNSNQAIRVSTRAGIPFAETLLLEWTPRSYWSLSEQGFAVWQYDPDKISALSGFFRPEPISMPRYFRVSLSVVDPRGQMLSPEITLAYSLDGVRYLKLVKANALGIFEIEVPRASSYQITCRHSGFTPYSVEITPDEQDFRHLDVVLR